MPHVVRKRVVTCYIQSMPWAGNLKICAAGRKHTARVPGEARGMIFSGTLSELEYSV